MISKTYRLGAYSRRHTKRDSTHVFVATGSKIKSYLALMILVKILEQRDLLV